VDLHHELPPSQSGVQSGYTLRALASVAGLAPARACLKGRARGLLCIHGRLAQGVQWSPGPVSRRRLLGFSEALIYLSYPGSEDWSSGAVTLRAVSRLSGEHARVVLCF
jgi:hypothetical protein